MAHLSTPVFDIVVNLKLCNFFHGFQTRERNRYKKHANLVVNFKKLNKKPQCVILEVKNFSPFFLDSNNYPRKFSYAYY